MHGHREANGPFARSGHTITRAGEHASCTDGLPKQRQVKVDWYELLSLLCQSLLSILVLLLLLVVFNSS